MAQITFKPLTHDLCQPAEALITLCFPHMAESDQYDGELEELIRVFPEGGYVAIDGQTVIGIGTGMCLDIDFYNLPPTEDALLYTDSKINHIPDGDYIYANDIAVHPEYRNGHIGKEIINWGKELVQKQNKKGLVGASALPGYAKFKHNMTISDYLKKVVAGQAFDLSLTMQLHNGFKVVRPIQHFFTFPLSDHWGAIIIWENPTYQAPNIFHKSLIKLRKKIREAIKTVKRKCFSWRTRE